MEGEKGCLGFWARRIHCRAQLHRLALPPSLPGFKQRKSLYKERRKSIHENRTEAAAFSFLCEWNGQRNVLQSKHTLNECFKKKHLKQVTGGWEEPPFWLKAVWRPSMHASLCQEEKASKCQCTWRIMDRRRQPTIAVTGFAGMSRSSAHQTMASRCLRPPALHPDHWLLCKPVDATSCLHPGSPAGCGTTALLQGNVAQSGVLAHWDFTF